jgi:hypothetical protein
VGGGFAQLLAPDGFSAWSANYGTVPKDADRVLAGPVSHRRKFLARRTGRCSSNNNDRADVLTLFVVMGKITGAKYHEPSARGRASTHRLVLQH